MKLPKVLLLNLYSKPFRYDEQAQAIFDNRDTMILDIRGFGYLSTRCDSNAEADILINEFGEWLTLLLMDKV